MKKFLLLGFFCMLWGWLAAENVNQQKAEEWAVKFFEQQTRTRNGGVTLQMVWNGEEGNTRGGAQPAFYVFNRTDRPGFVIVAGDDKVAPVLGYSFDNAFETVGMPENIRLWLVDRKKEINEVRVKGSSADYSAEWNLSRSIGQVQLILKTAQWNQDDPYNRECPNVNGKKAFTGCTATALAIAMRYRQWPDQGEGTLPQYLYQAGDGKQYFQNSRALGQPYQWDNMPLNVSGATSDEAKNEIARLMMDVAVMCRSTFDSQNGTGAIAQQTHNGLAKYMKYSQQMEWLHRDNYALSAWYKRIQEELKTNGPVVYTGNSQHSAHAFVLDGYTSANYFSVNWGWGGSNNGFFQLTAMNPSPGGIGGGDYTYNQKQTALVNMKKAEAGEVSQVKKGLVLRGGMNSKQRVFEFGMRAQTNYISMGKVFNVVVGSIYNDSNETLDFVLGIGVFDKDGKWKEKANTQGLNVPEMKPGYFFETLTIPCLIGYAPKEGDYLAMAYQMKGSTEWVEVQGTIGSQCRIPLVDTDRPIEGDAFLLTTGSDKETDFHGLYSEEKDIAPNQDFKVHTGYMRCLKEGYRGKLALCHFDVQKKFKSVVSDQKELNGLQLGSVLEEEVITGQIKGAIEKGDFLALCYWNGMTGDWTRIRGIDYVTARIELNEKAKPEPEVDLEAETSLTYNISTKRLDVKTLVGVEYVFSQEGSVVAQGVSDAQGRITYQPGTEATGTVTLEVTYKKTKKVITLEWKNE